MKRLIILILSLIFIIASAGCQAGSGPVTKAPATTPPVTDVPAAETTAADYPAAIMVDDVIYLLNEAPMSEAVDEGAVIGYTKSYTDTFPGKNGETNFNRELDMPYAEVENGIAVLYEEEWYLCTPKETDDSNQFDANLKSENVFTSFSAQKIDSNYQMKGTIYLSSERDLVHVEADAAATEIFISGTLKRKEGEIKLLFEDTDGNTTILIDSENSQENTIKVDLSLLLDDEGGGRFYFSGNSGIFYFDLVFSAPGRVNYYLNKM